MRLSAAMLAAVVDGFSELVDDGMMDLAAIVGDTVQRFCPSRARPSWMLCCEDVFVWAEWGCCCDAGAHRRLGPLRAKPLLSVFVDAPVNCDAGRCGEGEQQLQLEQQLQQRNKKFLEDCENFWVERHVSLV